MKASERDTFFQLKVYKRVKGWTLGRSLPVKNSQTNSSAMSRLLYIMYSIFRPFFSTIFSETKAFQWHFPGKLIFPTEIKIERKINENEDSNRQEKALEDYTETSVMLQYTTANDFLGIVYYLTCYTTYTFFSVKCTKMLIVLKR